MTKAKLIRNTTIPCFIIKPNSKGKYKKRKTTGRISYSGILKIMKLGLYNISVIYVNFREAFSAKCNSQISIRFPTYGVSGLLGV